MGVGLVLESLKEQGGKLMVGPGILGYGAEQVAGDPQTSEQSSCRATQGGEQRSIVPGEESTGLKWQIMEELPGVGEQLVGVTLRASEAAGHIIQPYPRHRARAMEQLPHPLAIIAAARL